MISIPEEDNAGVRQIQETKASILRRKILSSAIVYFVNFAGGWIVAIRGPSLLDLQDIAKTDSTGGSTFFTSAAIGGVLGALAGGALYDRFDGNLVIFLSFSLHAVSCALIPYCPSVWTMAAMFFVHDALGGGYKTGSNVEIIRLWRQRDKAAIQGLHFFFSFGASVSPLILSAFLSNPVSKLTNTTVHFDVNNTESYGNESYVESNFSPDTEVYKAFLISGALGILASLGFLYKFFADRNKRRDRDVTSTPPRVTGFPRWAVFLTLFLFLLLFFFLDEVEDSSPSFLSTFVVKGLSWSKVEGALLTSAFWGSFTVGRFLGIIAIGFLSHFKFFVLCSTCMLLGHLGLLLSALYGFHIGVWLSTVAVGVSISVVLPAILTWIEKNFLAVSGKVVSVIYAALAVGGAANPQLIGYGIQHVTYMVYSYILLTEALLFFMTLLALKLFLDKYICRFKTASLKEDEHLQETDDS